MFELSVTRLTIMRVLYALNLIGLGFNALPALFAPDDPLAANPMRAVALSFWGALSVLSILGLRYPVRMLPVLILQFTYKIFWLSSVLLPAWRASAITPDLADFSNGMVIGLLLDIVAIPWLFVLHRYLLAPGERWWGKGKSPSNCA